MAGEELFKAVDSIRFNLLSPSEIRKMSVVEVQTADTYDEDGVPIPSGLMDGRLGTLEPRQKCKTCGNTAVNCPGHFGHIELAEPIIHVSFVKIIHRLLTSTCRNCGRILLPEDRISHYLNEIERRREVFNVAPESVYDAVYREARKSRECPHCGAEQYEIEYMKPTTFHEIREGGAVRLTPGAVRERLERISDDDLALYGINPKAARPEWAVLQVLPVPPVTVRPSITLESGVRSEDDLTHKLVDIIRINQKLKEALDSGVPVNIIQELHDLLQYHVTTYFDNEVSGIPPARHRSGRALKTLSQRLKGKEGRFRGNLSGKRVDFSARTVISPDPNLELNEVGVPIDVASRLTVPVKVTPWNLDEMRELVRNGPNKYPGALYVIRPDNRRVRLEFVSGREELAEALQPGFIVERHLKDGDIVLFNRQPSLHRMSIMAHRVKVLPYKTFRLNPCVCPPYNADFDGDEMNLHVPQSEEARTEARMLMQVQDQILSPRYGGPIIGAIRDHLSASYLLTHKSTYLTKDAVARLLVAAGYEGPLPEPEVKGPRPLWSGKQLFSLFIPKDLNFVSKSNICSIYKCEECLREGCPYDAYIVVKDGQLISGAIDKAAIGAEKSESLLHRIVKDYGSDYGKRFLDSISKLLDRFITLRGFTYSLDELDIPEEVRKDIDKIIEESENNVERLIEKFRTGELERLPGQTLEESLEIYIMNELSRARDKAGERVEEYFTLGNSGIVMAATGARGSMLNIGQMSACLGQQSIRGKRISRGYKGRTLPFFKPGDAGAAARGFVYSCYRDGLSPMEFFFHAMGGREGLVDTAVRTQQSGYMQRRLINALEHIRVEYDGTVRDSDGDIIQFNYGEDGVDAAKSDHGKAVNIENIIARVKLKHERGEAAPSGYIEEQVNKVASQLTPILHGTLMESLRRSGLTRKGVDEVIRSTLRSYRRSLIEAGEAAGIVSAQSIGEPGTQMTLRTFHYAGVRERNVTLGLPRLIEIVDARRTPSTPSMTIYLDEEHRRDRSLAEDIANMITHTAIRDIADLMESDIVEMTIRILLDPEAMAKRKVSLEEVKRALALPHCEVSVSGHEVTLEVKGRDIPQFRRLAAHIPDLKVKGLTAVKRALVVEEDGEWIIVTEGSSLKAIMTVPGVDPTRTISNNIHEVAEVLGIEAARNVIIKEALEVLEEQGLDVDIRHIMLVADAMTASGEVKQVGRHGISGGKASTLARAAFEITVPTLVDAALKGARDELKGVAENVIVGQQIPMGTGLIEVYMTMPERIDEGEGE
ncbi:MAG: DNA-directed RNA polymerase subunit A' [Candidatus Bathyarchaeia archaeon]|nr:DNA-directed RNA polymerase subunit A' [Candidatus Bathyarchaeota archaeon]